MRDGAFSKLTQRTSNQHLEFRRQLSIGMLRGLYSPLYIVQYMTHLLYLQILEARPSREDRKPVPGNCNMRKMHSMNQHSSHLTDIWKMVAHLDVRFGQL